MIKNKYIYLLILCILCILTINILIPHNRKFYLEEKYYHSSGINKINLHKFNQLVKQKESFAIFIYQPMCITSSEFENVLSNFSKKNQINFYKIAFSDIKKTDVGLSLNYYPSFIIYNKGKMIDFLEADKNEDIDYYKSEDGFKQWFHKYVKSKI